LRFAVRELTRDHVNQAVFVFVTLVVGLGYSLLLPFSFTQRLSLDNWQYLDARFVVFSLAFGLAMGWLIATQTYAMRRVIHQRGGTLAGTGAVLGVLPSLLCCSPVVPTLLGFVGLSGVGLSHASGRIQSFFATNQNLILAVSLAVVVLAALTVTRRIVRAVCLNHEGCEPERIKSHREPAAGAGCPEPAERARPRETTGTQQ
jgi:hypothetical protein